MKTTSTSLNRMETMLRIWEQVLFVANAESRAASPMTNVGAIKNWRRFREAILDRSADFVEEDFRVSPEVFSQYFLSSLGFDVLPSLYWGWSRSSRRLYSLTEDTQRILELTAVGKVTWDDINPEFPYFAISLPIPMPHPNPNPTGSYLVDTIVVELDRSSRNLKLLLLGNELDSFREMPAKIRRKVGKAAGSHDIGQMLRVFEGLREDRYCEIPSTSFLFHRELKEGTEIIPDSFPDGSADIAIVHDSGVSEDSGEGLDPWRPFFRIVVGLCLHLELGKATGGARGAAAVQSDVFTLDPKAVVSGAELCSVQCEHRLTEDERAIHALIREKGIKTAMRELGTHFRGAHWRRPPGQGGDSTARKTVRVRWTLVNERRLPENALPRGTNVVVG